MRDKTIKRMAKWVKKHLLKIIVIMIVLLIAPPVLVWLCYNAENPIIITKITADGMLGYLGNILVGSASVVVAVVAVFQAAVFHDDEVERTIDARIDEIRPNLFLEIEKKNKGFSVVISNGGKYRAIGVWLFASEFSPLIEADKRVKRRVGFCDEPADGYLTVETDFYELSEDGYPKKICLYYKDIDHNLYEQIFRWQGGDSYDPEQPVMMDCTYSD